MIWNKTYTEPPICKKEILRYAGCKGSVKEESIEMLLEECLAEVLPKLSYKVCYIELPFTMAEDICDLVYFKVQSNDLTKNLNGCEKVILFAATIGVEMDRLIGKYGHLSPSKSVMMQAIGAERIESLCDLFCEEIEKAGWILQPRFSPGYGDLPLAVQKDIFRVLDCSKNIGLSLNESLIMSPSKSVTAFVGMRKGQQTVKERCVHHCASCEKLDCVYRE